MTKKAAGRPRAAAQPKPKAGAAPARRARKARSPLARLRALCVSLPEVVEKEAWGAPTFRVGGKMFAMFTDDHHGDGRVALWCKAPLGMQEILIDADPERFYKPPYVGPSGWVGVRLDVAVDWREVRGLLVGAWRMTAPRKLVPLLDA